MLEASAVARTDDYAISIRSEGFIQARLGLKKFRADWLTFAKGDFPTFDEESQLSSSILHSVPCGQ